jgi:hypothetical protein
MHSEAVELGAHGELATVASTPSNLTAAAPDAVEVRGAARRPPLAIFRYRGSCQPPV